MGMGIGIGKGMGITLVYPSSDRNSALFEIFHKELPYLILKSYEYCAPTSQACKPIGIGI